MADGHVGPDVSKPPPPAPTHYVWPKEGEHLEVEAEADGITKWYDKRLSAAL